MSVMHEKVTPVCIPVGARAGCSVSPRTAPRRGVAVGIGCATFLPCGLLSTSQPSPSIGADPSVHGMVCVEAGASVWRKKHSHHLSQPLEPLLGRCIFADLLSTAAAPPGDRFSPPHARISIESGVPDRFDIHERCTMLPIALASLLSSLGSMIFA